MGCDGRKRGFERRSSPRVAHKRIVKMGLRWGIVVKEWVSVEKEWRVESGEMNRGKCYRASCKVSDLRA